jgi:hypothetical protein
MMDAMEAKMAQVKAYLILPFFLDSTAAGSTAEAID